MTILLLIITALSAVLFAEFFGYWLHIVLHSDKIKWLSKSHMQHHLREYHPSKPLRLKGIYLSSGATRANIAGLGMEWVIPIGLMIVLVHGAFTLAGVPILFQLTFTASALAWSFVLFAYMHDAMHLMNFWMEKDTLLSRWYFNIRRYHDIHHYTFSDEGLMTSNFGICFFFFDALFGTLTKQQAKFNKGGLKASEALYSYIHS